MAIGRYDQAEPAQDNYFNTFVPLPMQELTALGMSRQQDLERNQSMIDKAQNDVLNIRTMPGADETTLKTQVIPAMNDLAMKFAGTDLSDPTQIQNFRREFRQKIDPNVVKNLEQSYQGYQSYLKAVTTMKEAGSYHPMLDDANIANWDTAKKGTPFSYIPESYKGIDSLLAPILKDLKSKDTVDLQHGVIRSSVDPHELANLATLNAPDVALSEAGQQEIRIFKRMHPDIAKDVYGNDDSQIMRHLIIDHGYGMLGGEKITPLGEGFLKYMDSLKEQEPVKQHLTSTGPGNVQSFNSFDQYKDHILNLKDAGDTEGAKDAQIKLNTILKKYDLPTESNDPAYKSGLPRFLEKTLPEFVENVGEWPRKSTVKESDFDTKVKQALGELSSTVSTKTSFGSPNFPSKSLMDEDLATGQKKGPSEMIDISNNIISHPNDNEIISINNAPPPDKKKLPGVMGALDTKNMIDLSLDKMPDKTHDYKPIVTFSYQDKKGGTIPVRVAITDDNERRAFANLAAKRGDYEAEASMNNPLVAATIEKANLDKPQTYYIYGNQKEADGKTTKPIPIKIERDGGGFKLTAPGNDVMQIKTRKEAISTIYQYMANNRNKNVKEGEPSSWFSETQR
jgi:hypothetical protein